MLSRPIVIPTMIDPDTLLDAYRTARDDLLAERTAAGHWVGELSTSALSTATATSAMSVVLREDADHPRAGHLWELIDGGVGYLARSQNADGGWGDTDKSLSNIATTMLVRAAVHLARATEQHAAMLARADAYIDTQGELAGLRRRYGRDKTFAVPILTNCALAGLAPWSEVSPLPFEMACLPHWLLGAVRLPVVSYAIPALVAIGQARYRHRPPRNPIAWLVRRMAIGRSLAVLRRMQPASGGYLEAAPLTAFVAMSLASIGLSRHPVVADGLRFLIDSVRPDGSWPIDTNLATWATTLSINALAAGGEEVASLGCTAWLLGCQHRAVHPFTSAAPGGWGWTDLSGAVPDADDTPGALLALAALRAAPGIDPSHRVKIDEAACLGLRWLLALQNRDGGWPTFCRGWGALPFDRSGSDLTAHALRALAAWRPVLVEAMPGIRPTRIDKAIERGLDYLARQQRGDGSWLPLWFGNQHNPDDENPVYGTARVLLAYRDLEAGQAEPCRRGLAWLVSAQLPDGGFGGPAPGMSSVEETAVAVEAMLWAAGDPSLQAAVSKGVQWLVRAVAEGRHQESSPIGFYFAKLWYYERLYPRIFTVSALGQAVRTLHSRPIHVAPRPGNPEPPR